MTDNIRNFSDYRKKVNLENQETEEINIEIQDPLDFLSASEREEYYRTQHEAMDRERESIREDSPEYYFDEDKAQRAEEKIPVGQSGVNSQRADGKRQAAHAGVSAPKPEKKKPAVQRERDEERPKKKPARNAGNNQPKPEKKQAVRKARNAKPRMQDEEWFDEDEDSASGINPYILVRIASVLTGIVILVFIGMLFKVKVYDNYLRPDPDEVSGTVQLGRLEGYTYTDDTVTTTVDLNLRNTPSTATDDFIVTQVPEGTVLNRLAVSDDGIWAQVVYEDDVLYCVMKYLVVNE